MAAELKGPWFRHYTDAHRHVKLRRLPESVQLFFFWLMELRREDKYPASPEDIAWMLHVDETRARHDLQALRDVGLLDPDGEIHNWSLRQHRSDAQTSTERVRAHRERKRRTVESAELPGPSSPDSQPVGTFHETFHGTAIEDQTIEEIQEGGNARARAVATASACDAVFPPSSSTDCPSQSTQRMLTEMAAERGVDLRKAAADAGVPLPIATTVVTALRQHLEQRPRLTPQDLAREARRADGAQARARRDHAFQELVQRLDKPAEAEAYLRAHSPADQRALIGKLDRYLRELYGNRYQPALEQAQRVGMGEAHALALPEVQPVLALLNGQDGARASPAPTPGTTAHHGSRHKRPAGTTAGTKAASL